MHYLRSSSSHLLFLRNDENVQSEAMTFFVFWCHIQSFIVKRRREFGGSPYHNLPSYVSPKSFNIAPWGPTFTASQRLPYSACSRNTHTFRCRRYHLLSRLRRASSSLRMLHQSSDVFSRHNPRCRSILTTEPSPSQHYKHLRLPYHSPCESCLSLTSYVINSLFHPFQN